MKIDKYMLADTFVLNPIESGFFAKSKTLDILSDYYCKFSSKPKETIRARLQKEYENVWRLRSLIKTIDNSRFFFFRYAKNRFFETYFLDLEHKNMGSFLDVLNVFCEVLSTILNFIWQELEACRSVKIFFPGISYIQYFDFIEKNIRKILKKHNKAAVYTVSKDFSNRAVILKGSCMKELCRKFSSFVHKEYVFFEYRGCRIVDEKHLLHRKCSKTNPKITKDGFKRIFGGIIEKILNGLEYYESATNYIFYSKSHGVGIHLEFNSQNVLFKVLSVFEGRIKTTTTETRKDYLKSFVHRSQTISHSTDVLAYVYTLLESGDLKDVKQKGEFAVIKRQGIEFYFADGKLYDINAEVVEID